MAVVVGIFNRIEAELGVTPAEIFTKSRTPRCCRARQLAIYAISKALPHLPDIQVARIVRNTHPTSVNRAYYTTAKRRAENPEFDAMAERVLA